ncbi:DUF6528 family protein [Sphingobacterium faecale]|uniref:Uncharacterized protein n=1 Tax=Sphingobacterium faecale TaxID=2803775 RepID=A0ABS1R917_9SPHI|nr:DUF6528 family protein [Sphingobacterium faecale]MBL1411196.1 hypothetical protein [Sphingobacterium faecale]
MKLQDVFNTVLITVALFLGACKEEKLPLLDFSDPFGNSAENNHPVPELKDSKRPILITDESEYQVLIVDSLSGGIMWQWKATDHLNTAEAAWFRAMDEAKVVYNKEYVLFTASSGGAGLVRIADKKLMFYTNAGGGPHSAELLPDGNIVVALSSGNALNLYRVDANKPYVSNPIKRYNLTFGHNAVWDLKREILWTTDDQNLYTYRYDNSDPDNPDLIKTPDFYPVPDGQPHDLFPVYGQDKLFLTTTNAIWIFDINTQVFSKNEYSMTMIKSISNGPSDFGTLVIKPTNDYWTNRLTNIKGSSVFFREKYRMYKARWFIENSFSYPSDHPYRQSK